MTDDYELTLPKPRVNDTIGWAAHGPRASRSLGHNGGPLPTRDYMSQNFGVPRVTPFPGDAQDIEGLSLQEARDANIGKTVISIAPPRSTTLLPTEDEEPDKMRNVGFAESVLGGLTEAFLGWTGHSKGPADVARGVGRIADIPLEAVGHVPLPFVPSREEAWELLPDNEDKDHIRRQMLADPDNADWYMAQYIRANGGELMNQQGLPRLLAPVLQPDATLLERGLMALGVPSQLVGRTYAGFAQRGLELLEEEDPTTLHPELQEIRKRYEAGSYGPVGSQQARDMLLDEMTTMGFGWTNDPFVSMLAEMVTDPLIVAGMGTGLAAKGLRTGAAATRAAAIGRRALALPATNRVRQAADMAITLERARGGRGLIGRNTDSTYRLAEDIIRKRNEPDFGRVVDEATEEVVSQSGNRARQAQTRASLWLADRGVIPALARASAAINAPLGIFGRDGAAGAVMRRASMNKAQGGVAGLGTVEVAKMFKGAGDNLPAVQEALGQFLAFEERAMTQGTLMRHLRMNLRDEGGKYRPPDVMPDTVNSPDKVIDGLVEQGRLKEEPLEISQFRDFVARRRELYTTEVGDIPWRDTGTEITFDESAAKREVARQKERMVEEARQKMMYGGELTYEQAAAIIGEGSENMLAVADALSFGRALIELKQAKAADMLQARADVDVMADAARASSKRAKGPRAAVEGGLSDMERIERATLVGPRELTKERATTLLRAIESALPDELAAKSIANEAIQQYELLWQNFYLKDNTMVSTERLLSDLQTFLKNELSEDKLVTTIDKANLPKHLQQFVDGMDARGMRSYQIGQAPPIENRWRASYNEKGELIGFNPWMDAVVDPMEVGKVGTFDVLRERMWTPIRAQNILIESRRKFISHGVRSYGLDRKAATDLYDAIRTRASQERTTMRSFTSDEFNAIIDNVDLPPEMKWRLGRRGLAELTARAMEGDLMQVGVTTKATGMLKTQTAHYANFMGVVAEKMYPLLRFNMNPFFLMQEWAEPYFFNIIRGVKSGLKFTEDQVEYHGLMDDWNMAAVLADGLESREFMVTGGYRARKGMGPQTMLGRLAAKFPVSRVQETKVSNFSRLAKKEFGQQFHDVLERDFPGIWARYQAYFNELDLQNGGTGKLSQGDIATKIMVHKGIIDPDSRTQAMLQYDGAVPNDLGRIDGIRRSHVAAHLKYDSIDALEQAIKDGSVDEWQFRGDLVELGTTSDYAARAWDVVNGVKVDDLLDSVEAAYADMGPDVAKVARDQTNAWTRLMSEVKGISQEEYVARKFARTAKGVDQTGKLPYKAFAQMADRAMESMGWEILDNADPRVAGVVQRAGELWPTKPHSTQQAHRNAAAKVAAGEDVTRNMGANRVRRKTVIEGFEMNPEMTTDDFIRLTTQYMDDASIHGAGAWYPQIAPMFASYVEAMGEAELRALGRLMNSKMKGPKKFDVDGDLADVRQEVTARMVMAWSATQVQTSPRDGFAFLTRAVDDNVRGMREGAAPNITMGMQQEKLRRMVIDFEENLASSGMGAKLYDFTDSNLQNRTRTFMEGGEPQTFVRRDGTEVPMEPAAMDIWMGRDMGFVDAPVVQYLADRIAKKRGLDADEAMVQAQLESGFFWRKDNEKAGPYRARKLAFEQKHGVELQEVWDGRPSPGEYETMLRRYNEITDDLNSGEGWLGRGYADDLGDQWTVADVQAIAWVRIQKALDLDAGGPTNMFGDNSAQVTFEFNPTPHTPLADAVPLWDAHPDAVDKVTRDVSLVLSDIVQQETGVTLLDYIPGYGATGDVISGNTTWRVAGNSKQLEDAIDLIQYLTQEDEVFAVKPPSTGIGNQPVTTSSKTTPWGIDFVPEADDIYTLEAMHRWLDDRFDWPGSANGVSGTKNVVRTVYLDGVENGSDMASFAAQKPIPDEVMAKLESGEWATEAGLDAAVPVTVERRLHNYIGRKQNWKADHNRANKRIRKGEEPETVYKEELGKKVVQRLEKRSRGDVAGRMVNRHLEAIQTVADQSLKNADEAAWARGRGYRSVVEGDGSGEAVYAQSVRNGRGWRGATAWNRQRSATERVARGELGTRRGRLYFKSDAADPDAANITTATHELFHIFADDLDPSAIESIHGAYARATKRKTPDQHNVLTRRAEEWAAHQFEEYVATGMTDNPTMGAVFNAYADAFDSLMGRDPQVNPGVAGVFKEMNPELHRGPKATFDVDQFRVLDAGRIALQRAEEEAFRTHFYKRGRTWLERSINHPYLGLYPASYMWGKVLPELMRFLVKKPFGVDAPFAGMQMANHVWEAIQLEMATGNDSTLQDLIEDSPEALRFLQLMVPGTPWDIPVNIPAWTRRIATDAWAGREPKIADALTDTIMYSYGPARAPSDLGEAAGDVLNFGKRAVDMAATALAGREWVPPDEREGEEPEEEPRVLVP